MAEANSKRATRPKLVSLSEDGGTKPTPSGQGPHGHPDAPRPRVVSRDAFTVVAALLAISLLGLVVQTQRVAARDEQIAALASRIEGLEGRLSAANARLAGYDVQLQKVRSSVAELREQVGRLAEIADADPRSFSTPEAGSPPR